MNFSPIVLFAYNRPHYLKETLIALKKNHEASQSDLFIFCDGSKSGADSKDIELVNEVRALAKSEQWCKNVYVHESKVNKGLSRSVIFGVTEIVNKYDKVIVLEDDIVPAPFFLKYMNEALVRYEYQDKVASISAYNYPINNLIRNKETFFLNAVSCWGWATWKRAWELFNDDAEYLLLQLKSNQKEYKFNFNNTFRYTKILKLSMFGKVDSWFIKWYASCFLANKLSLYPSKSLVKNIGMIGTHILGDNSKFIGDEYDERAIIDFDNSMSEDLDIRRFWQEHYKYFDRRKLNYRNIIYAISKLKMYYKFQTRNIIKNA